MGWSLNINQAIKQFGRWLALVIMLLATAICFFVFVYEKPQKSVVVDCTECEQEKDILIDLFIEIRKESGNFARDLSKSVSYDNQLINASYAVRKDTIPPRTDRFVKDTLPKNSMYGLKSLMDLKRGTGMNQPHGILKSKNLDTLRKKQKPTVPMQQKAQQMRWDSLMQKIDSVLEKIKTKKA